jgi:hypothetical protein
VEGFVGELAVRREMGGDGGGLGEGEELGWVEFFAVGECGEVEAVDKEGGEEVGVAVGEGREWGLRWRRRRVLSP